MDDNESIINLRIKWIAALRSGDYKQGRFGLCVLTPNGREHCVWGVACEVMGLIAVNPIPEKPFETAWYYDGENTFPPYRVSRALGIGNKTMGSLMGMNDRKQLTFKQLADIIADIPLPEPGELV